MIPLRIYIWYYRLESGVVAGRKDIELETKVRICWSDCLGFREIVQGAGCTGSILSVVHYLLLLR